MVKKISELELSNAVTTGGDMTVSEVLSEMARLDVREMLVAGEKDKLIGMITRQSIIDVGTNPTTAKVKTFMFKPPVLRMEHTVEDAARMMKETGVDSLPVLDGRDSLVGVVLVDEVVKALELGDAKVAEIMTNSPTVVREDAPIATARAVMKNHGISRLPVVDAKGTLVGVVSASDIVKKAMAVPRERERNRDTVEYKVAYMSTPVKSIMSKKLVTCSPEHKIKEAMKKMLQNNVRLLPVVKEGRPIGLVTKKQILGVPIGPGPEGINVYFSGLKDMTNFERQAFRDLVANRFRKLGKLMPHGEVEVSMKKVGASKVEVKLHASLGSKLPGFVVSAVSYDPELALAEALRMVERKVRNY